MRSVLAHGVLRRFALTQFLLEVQFWFPVWLIFLTGRDFSITTAVVADGVFRVTVVALELPFGVLADRVGRRRAYLGVAGLTVVTFVAITQVNALPQLFAAWVLWGVLWALSSGTASAYLYELVELVGVAEAATEPATGPAGTGSAGTGSAGTERVVAGRVGTEALAAQATAAFGALRLVTSTAVLASHLSAGFLYRVDERLPFLLTAALGLIAGGVALTLPEIHGSRRPGAGFRAVVHDLRQAWAGATLRITVMLSVLLLIFGWSATILFQPLILDLGLSSTAAGVTYFGYSAMAVAAGVWCGVGGAGRGPGSRRPVLITAGFVLLFAAVAATAVLPDLGPFVFIPVMGLGYHLAWTLLDVTVNERAHARVRATVASGISLVGGIAIAVARPTLGAVADRASAATAFGMWAVVGLVVTVLALALVRRLPAEAPELRS